MTMSAARFPHLGAIEHPTIDDYRMELMLIEADASEHYWLGNSYHISRWRKLQRRLQWAADARTPVSEPARRNAA